jgi:hypothetical protein
MDIRKLIKKKALNRTKIREEHKGLTSRVDSLEGINDIELKKLKSEILDQIEFYYYNKLIENDLMKSIRLKEKNMVYYNIMEDKNYGYLYSILRRRTQNNLSASLFLKEENKKQLKGLGGRLSAQAIENALFRELSDVGFYLHELSYITAEIREKLPEYNERNILTDSIYCFTLYFTSANEIAYEMVMNEVV